MRGRPRPCRIASLIPPVNSNPEHTMSMSIVDRRLLAAAIAAAVPFGLQAQVPRQSQQVQQIQQNQEIALGTYTGRVDKEVRITLRGNEVSSNTLSGTE